MIPPPSSPRHSRHQRAVALVTVLMMVALLALLVISLLAISAQHRNSSQLYSTGIEVRQLSDLAVNTVIGQIRQATVHPSDPAGHAPWASQPGAIRTWSTSGPEKLFKLYSSNEMVVDISSEGVRAALLAHEADLLASFDPSPDAPTAVRARLTDLNEPVTTSTSDGTTGLHFPIVDPRAALDTDPVEGFSFDPAAVPGTSDDPADPALPMPVEWLYVLRDGSLGSLDPDTLSYSGQGNPSRSNPIVGRIAFWTDDESSKINVNTASEPIPWDTPRADTTTERNYAARPPVANEVQRFPGHPATTALSTVLFPGRYAGQAIPTGASQLTDQQLRAIYDLAPRVNYTDASGAETGALGDARRAVAFDDDRLYASFDEILFSSSRDENVIPIDRLRRSRFFLTASSRAPETNVHGLPRVCLWPVSADVPTTLTPSNRRTAYDELIAFATTISAPEGMRYDEQGSGLSGTFGKGAYHFLRITPDSTHFGLYGPNSESSAVASNRARHNVQLIDYLFELATLPIPGRGASLDQKYGLSASFSGTASVSRRNARAAIQNQLGYARSLNLYDTTRITPTQRVRPYTEYLHSRGYVAGFHSVQPTGSRSEYQEYRAVGATANTGGPLLAIGRHHAISELAIALTCTGVRTASGSFSGANTDSSRLANGTSMIDFAILPEYFAPGHGFPMLHYRFRSLLQGISGEIRWETPGGATVSYPLQLANFIRSHEHPFDNSNPASNIHFEKVLWGGSGGPEWHVAQQAGLGQNHRGFYLNANDRIPVPSNVTHLELRNIVIELATREGVHPDQQTSDSRILQRYRFAFPNTKVPLPRYDPALDARTPWQNRIIGLNEGLPLGTADSPGIHAPTGKGGIIRGDDTDVIRSLVVGHGDYRLVSMHVNPGRHGYGSTRYGARQLFVPCQGYFDENRYLAHSLVGSGGHSRRYPGTTLPLDRGLPRSLSLTPVGAAHPPDRQPDLPLLPGEEGFTIHVPPSWPHPIDPALTRDWDNGVGPAPDGAYWNLADGGARLGTTPYFDPLTRDFGPELDDEDETFPPNRLIASAVTFGSIPSLPLSYIPWTTFLFRPDITPGGHFGSAGRSLTGPLPGAPPDHLWLDLYWMPVVQPYAISEPFSTAGKINMNFQILPFTHIRRATGLHATLKSEEFLAIPSDAAPTYKSGAGDARWRHRIDPEATLAQFDERFSDGDLFLTESELCELFLVPFGQTASSMPSFWQAHALTGDNTLEKPYANLYPRLTTRSNTLRVHFKVQTLQLARSSRPDSFDPDLDLVTGEFQGATVVERYLEPKDPAIPDYVHQILLTRSLDDLPSLDRFYRFRVLETRRFAP
jgi:hypothetical protein